MPSPTAPLVDTTSSPYATQRPLGVAQATITDGFWARLLRQNEDVTLATEHAQCRDTGALRNFARAAGAVDAPFSGRYYSDSDVYKWMEAVSWAIARGVATPELVEALDDVVALVGAAQDDDGYLNTYFSVDLAGDRWSNIKDKHELYLLGHLTQAAVAHHRATGSDALLSIAVRALEHVYDRFTPGQVRGTCGHPCLEMALVELYRTTGDGRWLELAKWQVDSRGRGVLGGSEYLLDHAPVLEQDFVTGHAVRAVYLYAGVADLALETGDEALRARALAWWDEIEDEKRSITGGIGGRWDGEAFGEPYELPDRAYNESCAAIGLIYFAWRLLLLTGESRFRDAIERLAYNAVLPGLSLDGTKFFYQNPLADAGRHRREDWFECACCPPNLARFLASLTGMIATTSDATLTYQFLVTGLVEADVDGGSLRLASGTDLPTGTSFRFSVEEAPTTPVTIRVPRTQWARQVRVLEDGRPVDVQDSNGYLAITRVWTPGSTLEVRYEHEPELVTGGPSLAAVHGRAALIDGPLVYCLEDVDNPGAVRRARYVPGNRWERVTGSIGEIPALRGTGLLDASSETLYRPVSEAADFEAAELVAIPYFAWANRVPGPMQVMIPLA